MIMCSSAVHNNDPRATPATTQALVEQADGHAVYWDLCDMCASVAWAEMLVDATDIRQAA